MSGDWFDLGDLHFATNAIHAGNEPEKWMNGEIVAPIVTSTTFKQTEPGVSVNGYRYSRYGNPTRDVLEQCLAGIENSKFALTFTAGVGALTAVGHLLEAGDHIVCIEDVFAGMALYFNQVISKYNISTTYVDLTNIENIKPALQDNTKLVWLENPTNPLLKVIDVLEIVKIVRDANPNIIVVLDNTFVTPYFQRPLQLGADISLYSLSKYMNGQHDAVMGAICTNSETLYNKLKFLQKNLGLSPSPFDCYLVNRSLKTLKLRMQKHFYNGLKVAEYLENHPKIEKVIHPGLKSHPQHELALKKLAGHSGMVSVYIKGGSKEATKFTTALKVGHLCDSLGGVDTTVVLPAVFSKGLVEGRPGITDNLIRISVGLEEIDDIITDLEQALEAM